MQFDCPRLWIMPHNFKPPSFVCWANLRACFLGDEKCGIREINANSGLKDMDQHTLSNVDASSGGCYAPNPLKLYNTFHSPYNVILTRLKLDRYICPIPLSFLKKIFWKLENSSFHSSKILWPCREIVTRTGYPIHYIELHCHPDIRLSSHYS